jgi:hypothetical protein
MAKKTRKQKQRAPARRPQASASAATPASPPAQAASRPAATRVLPQSVLPDAGTSAVIESEPETDNGAAVATAGDAYAAGDGSARRRVQRVNPAAQPRSTSRTVTTAAMFMPLDSEDAAIPFDRVPYVPRDLRRVAIMASIMIVLILIAAFVVTRINP